MIIYLGQTLSEEPHISLSQQLERPKIPKQLPAVDDGSLKTKTDIVPKKMQLRPSPGKSAIPVAHHTIPKSKGEKSVLLQEFQSFPNPEMQFDNSFCSQ